MTRIKNYNIRLGDEFVVPTETSAHQKKIEAAMEQERLIIAGAEQNASQILAQAKTDGERLIEEAKAQAYSEQEAIKKEAYDEGFEAGRKQGYDDITQELTDKIIAVDKFAQSNFDLKSNIIKSANLDIVQLVINIAQKVCSKSLELDDKILLEITENAIKSLKEKENISIIVNPEMAEKIYAITDELKERISQLENIKIIEDNSVSPDGTIVESPLSRVDSRVKSQIDEIADKLMAKLDSTTREEFEKDD